MPFSPRAPAQEGKLRVSIDGGRAPKWSHNGAEIFYRSLDNYLMAAAGSPRASVLLFDKPRLWSRKRLADIGPPNFDVAPDGKHIVALIDADDAQADKAHLRVLLNIGDELRRRH